MSDQPWKPLTLAALRPSDSRSNYGAVERILKSYDNTAWTQRYQNHTQPTESSPNPNPGFSPSPNPGFSPSPNPGFSPSPNPGFSPSPNPGFSPSPNPDFSPSPNPGFSPSPNPGFSPSPNPGPSPSLSPNPGPSASPNPGFSPRQEEELMDLLAEMMDKDYWDPPGPASGQSSYTHSHHSQLTSSHGETRLTMQECKVSSSSSSVQKNFSRPACPANRRPPSRWASSSTSSSSTSSSSSSTPINQPSPAPPTKHTSFSYSAYHTETVII
ncbi:mucin-1 [Salmo trutta]|uniref:mucin-1 n=1 Tax=Salmo trutta TaxID=8032 RepID=UPI0011326923|nr:mucin-1-like [Salmo trutta]